MKLNPFFILLLSQLDFTDSTLDLPFVAPNAFSAGHMQQFFVVTIGKLEIESYIDNIQTCYEFSPFSPLMTLIILV